MPPQVRELIAELEAAGFANDRGKGSHRNFRHPKIRKRVTISGQTGDDAQHYQIKRVKAAIKESKW